MEEREKSGLWTIIFLYQYTYVYSNEFHTFRYTIAMKIVYFFSLIDTHSPNIWSFEQKR